MIEKQKVLQFFMFVLLAKFKQGMKTTYAGCIDAQMYHVTEKEFETMFEAWKVDDYPELGYASFLNFCLHNRYCNIKVNGLKLSLLPESGIYIGCLSLPVMGQLCWGKDGIGGIIEDSYCRDATVFKHEPGLKAFQDQFPERFAGRRDLFLYMSGNYPIKSLVLGEGLEISIYDRYQRFINNLVQ